MQSPELAYIGLNRITSGVGLANLAYNMCRSTQLIRLGCIPAAVVASYRRENSNQNPAIQSEDRRQADGKGSAGIR